MTLTVPGLTVLCIAVSCLMGIAIPVGLLLYFKKKKGADFPPFPVGAAAFLIFVGAESVLLNLLLSTPAGEAIQSSLWLYALVGGLMPGLFEETARYVAFRFVLRKRLDKDVNALMYGAGHGGVEVFIALALPMVSNLSFALMMNNGQGYALTENLTGEALENVSAHMELLATTPSWQFLLGIPERVSAVAIHLSLSVLVWFAVKKRAPSHYVTAVLLHAVADSATAVLSGLEVPALALEAILLVIAAGCAAVARRVWRENAVSLPAGA